MKKNHSINHFFYLLLICSFLFLNGCGSDIPDTPDGTVEAVISDLKKDKVDIVWKALPESYQNDLNEIVHGFANKMDKELYNKGFSLTNQIVNVLKDKKEFILNNPFMAANPNVQKNKAKIEKEWSTIVNILETITKSDISDLSTMKNIDLGYYMKSTGNELMEKLSSIIQLATKESQTKNYNDIADIKLLSSENDHAVVNIIYNDDSNEELKMSKIEGRWIPSDLAADWKTDMSKAKKAIADISSEQIAQVKAKTMGAMLKVEASVSQIAKAKEQNEFNQAVQNTIATILSLGLAN